MSKERLDYQKLCPNHYSNYEDGCCMESCEIYNHDECPVVYVNELISDLEAKLAESEKHNAWVLEFLEKCKIDTNSTPEYSQNPIIEYLEQVSDFRAVDCEELKQQLAESEERLELADCIIKQYADKDKNYAQQLAEKEKEIEGLRENSLSKRIFKEKLIPSHCMEQYEKYEQQIDKLTQDKISFAVEQLEKVKELFESCWDYYFDIGELCDKYLFYDKIDQLIAELTHQHEDK